MNTANTELNSFKAVICLWPSIADFADDIKVPYPTAAAMKQRSSIAPHYWEKVVTRAAKRGFDGVTHKKLSELAKKKKDQ